MGLSAIVIRGTCICGHRSSTHDPAGKCKLCGCSKFLKDDTVPGMVEDLGLLSPGDTPFEYSAAPRQPESGRRYTAIFWLGIAVGLILALILLFIGKAFFSLLLLALAIPIGLVTNAGVAYMATDFASGGVSPRISAFNFHDSGTGTNAPAVTDTGLQTPTGGARVAGTQSTPGSTNVYRTVATISYTSTLSITEWGVFSASSSGTLWDRRTFTAIGVNNGDAIQFTYSLTIPSGGT